MVMQEKLWSVFGLIFEDGREAKIRYKYMDFITKEYRDNFVIVNLDPGVKNTI